MSKAVAKLRHNVGIAARQGRIFGMHMHIRCLIKIQADVYVLAEQEELSRAPQAKFRRAAGSNSASVIALVLEPRDFLQSKQDRYACNVYISQNGGLPDHDHVRIFSTKGVVEYEPFCDDFGPMNLLNVVKFIELLEDELYAAKLQKSSVVYSSDKGPRNLTNAIFLFGAYMILKLGKHPDAVQECFDSIDSSLVEGYRDATFVRPDFRLQLIDCWKGLFRGKDLGWVAAPTRENPTLWGQIDIAEYERYDDYCNGDLHTVVPDKFVAFKGPKDIPGAKYKDCFEGGHFSCRDFSPLYYKDIFADIGVTAVVRLNEVCYRAAQFRDFGIDHHDLFFEDCTCPPAAVVARFFHIVDTARGLVAIHCKAGLGRTGTLIALALMRSHGFSAREAMGWLRIMRPGSVIGEQQAFLSAVEYTMQQELAAGLGPPAAGAGSNLKGRRASALAGTPAAAAEVHDTQQPARRSVGGGAAAETLPLLPATCSSPGGGGQASLSRAPLASGAGAGPGPGTPASGPQPRRSSCAATPKSLPALEASDSPAAAAAAAAVASRQAGGGDQRERPRPSPAAGGAPVPPAARWTRGMGSSLQNFTSAELAGAGKPAGLRDSSTRQGGGRGGDAAGGGAGAAGGGAGAAADLKGATFCAQSAAEVMAEQVAAGMDRRGARRAMQSRGGSSFRMPTGAIASWE